MRTAALLLCLGVAGHGPSGGNGFTTERLSNGDRLPLSQRRTVTVWDGVYTQEQAARGEKAYKLSCGYCHKDTLEGGFFDDGTGRAPALAGPRAFDSSFEKRWAGSTVGEMLIEIGTTMPQQDPGSLPPQTYVDILTFLLSRNGAPAGASELPADLEALQRIGIDAKPAR